jgi:hypothetical protein
MSLAEKISGTILVPDFTKSLVVVLAKIDSEMIEPIDMAAFMDAYQTPGRGGRGCPKV